MASCRNCRREIHQVLGVWRGTDFLSWCGIGDSRHEPESAAVFTVAEYDAAVAARSDCNPGCECGGNPVKAIVYSTPSGEPSVLVKEFAKTQRATMRRKS